MAGIYVASADELSLRSDVSAVRRHGARPPQPDQALRKIPPSGNLSPFLTLRGGLKELVDKLVAAMPGVRSSPPRSAR
jgi:protoporphyrinogen oxidase